METTANEEQGITVEFSEEDKILSKKAKRLAKMIRAQEMIKGRYEIYENKLNEFLDGIRDPEMFSPTRQHPVMSGPHKYQPVWDIDKDENKKLGEFIRRIQATLTSMLNQLKRIDKWEEFIEQEEAAEWEKARKEGMVGPVDVRHADLRYLLEKFQTIWGKIEEKGIVEETKTRIRQRSKIIDDIIKCFESFNEDISLEAANIYMKPTIKKIRKFLKHVKELEKNNKHFWEKFIKQEHILEGKERELVKLLVRGLKLRERGFKFMNFLKQNEIDYPHEFVDGRTYYETTRSKEEEDILLYSITPLILKANQVTKKFANLIDEENKEIDLLKEFSENIKEKKLPSQKEKTIAVEVRQSILRLKIRVKDTEEDLVNKIKELQIRIRHAIEFLSKLEEEREPMLKKRREEIERKRAAAEEREWYMQQAKRVGSGISKVSKLPRKAEKVLRSEISGSKKVTEMLKDVNKLKAIKPRGLKEWKRLTKDLEDLIKIIKKGPFETSENNFKRLIMEALLRIKDIPNLNSDLSVLIQSIEKEIEQINSRYFPPRLVSDKLVGIAKEKKLSKDKKAREAKDINQRITSEEDKALRNYAEKELPAWFEQELGKLPNHEALLEKIKRMVEEYSVILQTASENVMGGWIDKAVKDVSRAIKSIEDSQKAYNECKIKLKGVQKLARDPLVTFDNEAKLEGLIRMILRNLKKKKKR